MMTPCRAVVHGHQTMCILATVRCTVCADAHDQSEPGDVGRLMSRLGQRTLGAIGAHRARQEVLQPRDRCS